MSLGRNPLPELCIPRPVLHQWLHLLTWPDKKQLKVPCPNEVKAALMKKVLDHADLFGPGEPNITDGLRLESSDSWTLIRPSGTEPIIRISAESLAEAKTQELLEKAGNVVAGMMSK